MATMLVNNFAYSVADYTEIQGSKILDLNDGTYKVMCNLASNSVEDYRKTYENLFKSTKIAGYLTRDTATQIPLLKSDLELVFTVRDGVLFTNRKFSAPEYNQFKIIAASNDFTSTYKDPRANLISGTNEYTIYFYNLTATEAKQLPLNVNQPFYSIGRGALGHSDAKFEAVPVDSQFVIRRSNIYRLNKSVGEGRLDLDGKLLLSTGLGEPGLPSNEFDVIIDPLELNGALRLVAGTSYSPARRSGGNGDGDNTPAHHSTVNYKYGTVGCKLFSKNN